MRGLWPALVLLAAAVGCTRTDERRPVDAPLLAALGLAQAYQHQADEQVALGHVEEAIGRVRLVLEIPFPHGAPEAEDVRLDAHGRLAELLLARGELDDAEAALRAGRAEVSRRSYFGARLHAVEGRVLRERARRLRDEGNEAAAREVSRRAIEALERSIEVNRLVLGLSGDGPRVGDGGGDR